MLNKVKDVVFTIGDETGDLAKRFGCNTADLAKRFGNETADLAKRFGSETAGLAKRFGNETADLAKRVGPKRGLIGLAVAAVAIGGTIVLVRYLRARNAEEIEADLEPHETNGRKGKQAPRAQRKASHIPMPH